MSEKRDQFQAALVAAVEALLAATAPHTIPGQYNTAALDDARHGARALLDALEAAAAPADAQNHAGRLRYAAANFTHTREFGHLIAVIDAGLALFAEAEARMVDSDRRLADIERRGATIGEGLRRAVDALDAISVRLDGLVGAPQNPNE